MSIRDELVKLQRDIEEHADDTCWCGPAETVVDRIEWMLQQYSANDQAQPSSNEQVTPVDGLIAESRAVLATHLNGTWKDDYAALRLAQMVRALLARIEETTALQRELQRARDTIDTFEMEANPRPAHEPATELSDDFRKGVRAVFDSLLCRAANNYHGNPDVNASCTEENKIVTAWAADALAEVSVDDWNEWVSITDLRRENDELKAQVRAAPPPSDDLAVDVAGALERIRVKETLVEVYLMAHGRTDNPAYWAGFETACDEIAVRLQEQYGEEMTAAEAWVCSSVTKGGEL